MRILIIDDEVLTGRALSRIASIRGHTAKTAVTGQAGLALWRQFQPHLVFLDIVIPLLDGLSVMKAVERCEEKIVIISAIPHFDPFAEKEIDVDLFIPKPFTNVVTTFIQAEKLCGCHI